MPISRSLSSRIESGARAPDFWYVPKGSTVNIGNWDLISARLQVLQGFQSVPWNEAQPLFRKELLKRKLIKPYKEEERESSAVARMQLPVWRRHGRDGHVGTPRTQRPAAEAPGGAPRCFCRVTRSVQLAFFPDD